LLQQQQLQAELGDAYDQPQEEDDEFYHDDSVEHPFRFLTHWTMTDGDNKSSSLPTSTMTFPPGTVFTGTLLPSPKSSSTEPITIRLEPESYCMDRSPCFRGYWLVTETAYYWLHDPAAAAADNDAPHLEACAVLVAVSAILHRAFGPETSNASAAKRRAKLTLPAVAQELMPLLDDVVPLMLTPAVATAVHQHLVGAHPALTPRCAFLQSLLQQPASDGESMMPRDELLRRCQAVERRLPQTSWGQPRALPAEIVEEEEQVMKSRQEEQATKPPAKKPKRSNSRAKKDASMNPTEKELAAAPKSKRSNSRPATGRSKRAKAPAPESSDDEEMPGVASTSPSSVEVNDEQQTTTTTTTSRRRRAATKRVNYADDDDDEFDDSSVEERPQRKKKPSSSRRAKIDSSSDEASVMESSDSEELSGVENVSSESSSESEEEDKKPRAKIGGKAAAAKAEPAKKEKSKMCDSFAPMNTPSYKDLSLETIHEEKEFLDPCGLGSTDDIIDSLVGEQVDKIGSLLQRSSANDNVGSAKLPLKLGTACSGTDAPALALTLVSEQMELRGLGGIFHHSHEFSCENDPFKQGMLVPTLYHCVESLLVNINHTTSHCFRFSVSGQEL